MRSPAGGEIGEAPPVADEASRFRGSAPIGGHDSARESVGTTVGKRAPPLRTTRYAFVGADAYIGPTYRTPCNASVGATLAVARPTQAFHPLRRGGRLCPPADSVPHSLQKTCHCEPVTDVTGCGNPQLQRPYTPKTTGPRPVVFRLSIYYHISAAALNSGPARRSSKYRRNGSAPLSAPPLPPG